MEYREIVAVTGLGGLYQLLATKSDGAIVRNLADKNTKFISARLHNVTPLESIEVYTTGENVRLHEVFLKMKEQEDTTTIVNAKAPNNDVKGYFMSIFPELDEDRVYISDMKKMVKWYQLLKDNDLLKFETAPAESETETDPAAAEAETEVDTKATKKTKTPAKTEDKAEEKPAKKARAKKAAVAEGNGEEKPAKKTARAKKTEEK